jgi:hypothetical protein
MYDRFSGTGKHSTEWVQITKEFLKLSFAGGCREASCPCSRCENRRMLSEYEMSTHIAKERFMLNYLHLIYFIIVFVCRALRPPNTDRRPFLRL